MYKVLIVDDEPSIREGLRTLIDWRRFGFEICGEAANGKEGLRECARHNPDLVLADIRMPGMDGLGMIEEARKMGLSGRFMVLTGYSEFQYAKRAINEGVECYLLKPIDAGELELQVGRLQRDLAHDRTMREQASEGRARQTERLLHKLLSAAGTQEGISAYRELADRLGFPWESHRVLLVEMEPNPCSAAGSLEAKELLRMEIETRGIGYVCAMDDYAAVLLNETSTGAVKAVLEGIRRTWLERWQAGMLVYAGQAVIEATNLSTSYESALRQARHKFVLRSETGIWIEQAAVSRAAPPDDGADGFDSDATAGRLAMAVDSGHADVLREEGEKAIRLIVREDSFEQSIKIRTAMLYLSVFHRVQPLVDGQGDRMASFRTVPSEWNACLSLEGLREAFVSRVSELSEAVNQDRPGAALHRILDFIRRHHDKELKLEMLAEMYHYNSGYLGKMFRQQTGEYFNTYLDLIRMEHAKELLKQGLKVHQVAVKVGYNNVDYFHAKFKKYVGMPPSAFRDIPDL